MLKTRVPSLASIDRAERINRDSLSINGTTSFAINESLLNSDQGYFKGTKWWKKTFSYLRCYGFDVECQFDQYHLPTIPVISDMLQYFMLQYVANLLCQTSEVSIHTWSIKMFVLSFAAKVVGGPLVNEVVLLTVLIWFLLLLLVLLIILIAICCLPPVRLTPGSKMSTHSSTDYLMSLK